MKKKSWVEEQFGKPCDKCGKRHNVFATIGENLPKSAIKCDQAKGYVNKVASK